MTSRTWCVNAGTDNCSINTLSQRWVANSRQLLWLPRIIAAIEIIKTTILNITVAKGQEGTEENNAYNATINSQYRLT